MSSALMIALVSIVREAIVVHLPEVTLRSKKATIQALGALLWGAVCATSAFAALDIRPSSFPQAMNEAAARLSLPLHVQPLGCGETGKTCRFDLGDAVTVEAISFKGERIDQVEASWNNDSRASSPASMSLYLSACTLVVAIALPQASANEDLQLAEKIAVTKFSRRPQIDVEIQRGPLTLYGSRARPDSPDFPSEAFLQCGAVRND